MDTTPTTLIPLPERADARTLTRLLVLDAQGHVMTHRTLAPRWFPQTDDVAGAWDRAVRAVTGTGQPLHALPEAIVAEVMEVGRWQRDREDGRIVGWAWHPVIQRAVVLVQWPGW